MTVRARLVVAADGARSATRAAAGLRTVSMPYSQRGVVATVSTAAQHGVAWQRFLQTGPLALLPTRYLRSYNCGVFFPSDTQQIVRTILICLVARGT